jgi:hypothetical protein
MLNRLSPRVLVLSTLGSIAIAIAIALWLQIPDSHTWEFVLSVLTGLAIVLATLWLKATVIRQIRINQPATAISMAVTAFWAIVTAVFIHLIHLLSVQVDERAGFWNSRLSAHQRTIFTYGRLVSWQTNAIETLLWFILPALLLPLILETVSGASLKSALRTWKRWQLWLTVAAASILANWLTTKLVDWHPAQTVHGELISAIARLSLLYALLLAIALITLSIVSSLLSKASINQN